MILAKSGRTSEVKKWMHHHFPWHLWLTKWVPLYSSSEAVCCFAFILFLDIVIMVKNPWQGFKTRKPFKIIICICKAKKVKKQNHWTFLTLGHLQGQILKHLLIQQWKPSLNRQVHCFNAILFPSGIT